jgi:TonB family protein
MKKLIFLFCPLLLVTVDALAQSGGMAPPPSAWQRYTVRGEEFSIILPALPAMTTEKRTRNLFLRDERTQRQLGAYADGVVYMIFSDDHDPRGGLNNASKRIMSNKRGPALEEEVSCDGFTGKQYTLTDSPGGLIQVFATKKHFYEIQAFGASADDPSVKQFFASLTLRKKDEAVEVSDGPGTPFEPLDATPADPIFTSKQVDRRVMLCMKPEPNYTEPARQHEVTGVVVLKAVLSANGSVLNITVVSDLPYGLTERSIKAAQKLKFIPAVKDGKFVSSAMQLEYHFNLY